MADEIEPTPAAPAPEAAPPADTAGDASDRAGVRVPKWLAVAVVALALTGGGFAIGRVTAPDHHGGFAPMGVDRPGGGPGGAGGLGRGSGPDGNGTGDSNAPTTPSTTPGPPGGTGT